MQNFASGSKVLKISSSALESRISAFTNCNSQLVIPRTRSSALDEIFKTFEPDAVIHFAGLKAVGESVSDPVKYYDVNVGGSISLLAAMSNAECNTIVFSSGLIRSY